MMTMATSGAAHSGMRQTLTPSSSLHKPRIQPCLHWSQARSESVL